MWVVKIMAHSGTCIHIATEVLETLHPGTTGWCWSGMYMFATIEFPQPNNPTTQPSGEIDLYCIEFMNKGHTPLTNSIVGFAITMV